jgi:kanamycin kinase
MSVPAAPVPLPPPVAHLARTARVTPVWRNDLGGVTWRLDGDGGARYLRWSPPGAAPDLDGEVARLRWVRRHRSVPEVLDAGRADGATWLLTAALPGTSAVDATWVARPREAALAVGRGLRALHDALPVDACPFSWSVADRVAAKSGSGALEALVRDRPDDDRVVVCHGDACAPNTLLADDGTVAGHVDLGRLGVADRWADLAAACWSADFNYGPGHADVVCEGYGVAPDRERLAWYLALWDAEDA